MTAKPKWEVLIEAQYKCGCTWTGAKDSAPELCAMHKVTYPRAILKGALLDGVNHPDNAHVRHGWIHAFGYTGNA